VVLPQPEKYWVTLEFRLVFPQGIVFHEKVPTSTTLGALRRMVRRKHGNSVRDVQLFRLRRTAQTELAGEEISLYDCGIHGGAEDAGVKELLWYDFVVPESTDPILRRDPDLSIADHKRIVRDRPKAIFRAAVQHVLGADKMRQLAGDTRQQFGDLGGAAVGIELSFD